MPYPTFIQWPAKSREADVLMESRRDAPDALVEISAQHPLLEGLRPNAEFEARLRKGAELYRAMQNDVRRNVYMLVPGSRHRDGAHADHISLSAAGADFLRAQGIPKDHIFGEDAMERFKGPTHRWPGVYNSADEAYLAASAFKENDDFGSMFSIVSHGQAFRKRLHYLWNGVKPDMVTLQVRNAYHNILMEMMTAIPYTVFLDPDWQSPSSQAARKSRLQRRLDE